MPMSRYITRRRTSGAVSSAFLSSVKNEYSYPCIGEFAFRSLVPLQTTPRWKVIFILAACCLVWIHIMCSIRESTDEDNAEYDARYSVKFYKSGFIGGGHVIPLAAALAIVGALGVLPSLDPQKIDDQIQAAVMAYKPNVKLPKQLTASNYPQWVNGSISRIIGLLNSCPAAVASISKFGIQPGTSGQKSLEDIVNGLPLPGKVSHERIAYELRVMMGLIDRTGKKTREKIVTFEEPMINSSDKLASEYGLTKLEYDVFCRPYELTAGSKKITVEGVEMVRAGHPSERKVDLTKKPMYRAFERHELETHLTPLELLAYDQAAKIGNKKLLNSLNEKVQNALATATTLQSKNSEDYTPPPPIDFNQVDV